MHRNARLTPEGRRILCERIASGRPAAHVAAEMGVSRTTAYRWWNRYQTEDEAGLYDRPSRPRSCPHQTPVEFENKIVELRRTKKLGPGTYWPHSGDAGVDGVECAPPTWVEPVGVDGSAHRPGDPTLREEHSG